MRDEEGVGGMNGSEGLAAIESVDGDPCIACSSPTFQPCKHRIRTKVRSGDVERDIPCNFSRLVISLKGSLSAKFRL